MKVNGVVVRLLISDVGVEAKVGLTFYLDFLNDW